MQIEWLPGARMEEGELMLDPTESDDGERAACGTNGRASSS